MTSLPPEPEVPEKDLGKLLEIRRRFGMEGVEALLEVTDQTRRKHTFTVSVGAKPDQVTMAIVSEWTVRPAKGAA